MLSTITSAAETSSNAGSPDISKLQAQGTALQESISSQTMSIALTRTRVTELSDQIHAAYRELFEASVKVIEQTIHGSVARGVKARAEHLYVVAKGMELKLQSVVVPRIVHGSVANHVPRIVAQTDPVLTDPLLYSALQSYSSHLAKTEQTLAEREATALKALKGYENAKGMADIAKRYAQVLRETEEVEQEISRLKDGPD